jgi:hypothetical protein
MKFQKQIFSQDKGQPGISETETGLVKVYARVMGLTVLNKTNKCDLLDKGIVSSSNIQ